MNQGDTFTNNRGNNQRGGSPFSRGESRNFGSSSAETYVPGMHSSAPGTDQRQPSMAESDQTPVVGFLYSISRQGIGEYWPLHLGTNTIGRSSQCDIVLKERSVSDHHATLSIKQMKQTHNLIASIRDVGSKNGMYLNDEELDYDNHTCKANDIITIGTSYQLLLLLINAEDYGLTVAENFVADEEEETFFPGKQQFAGGDDTRSNFNPYNSENRNVDTGTVDLNGAQFQKPGGTKFM